MCPFVIFVALRIATGSPTASALLHALVTTCISLTHVPNVFHDDVAGTCQAGRACAAILCQYMVYDLMNLNHWTYYVHHVLSILASSYVLYTDTFSVLTLFVAVNEFSTVFMYTFRLNIVPIISQYLFVVSFFMCRNVWLLWIMWNKPIQVVFVNTIMYLHYGLNTYWLYKIVQKMAQLRQS